MSQFGSFFSGVPARTVHVALLLAPLLLAPLLLAPLFGM